MRLLSNLLGKKTTPVPTNFGAPGVNANSPHIKPADASKGSSITKDSVKSEPAKAQSDLENGMYAGVQLRSSSLSKNPLPKESQANAINPYAAVNLKPIATIQKGGSKNVSEVSATASNAAPNLIAVTPVTLKETEAVQAPSASSKLQPQSTDLSIISAVQTNSSPSARKSISPSQENTASPPEVKAFVSQVKTVAPNTAQSHSATSSSAQYIAQAQDEGDWQTPHSPRKRSSSRSDQEFVIIKRDEVRAAMAEAAKQSIVESNESLSNDQAFAKAFTKVKV